MRAAPGRLDDALAAVRANGGEPGRALPIVNGFVASMSADAAGGMRLSEGVVSVTPDVQLTPLQDAVPSGPAAYDPLNDLGSMATITRLTGAQDLWACGITGTGVDVALIDSGVSPVAGTGPVINAVDLSLGVQQGDPAFLDAFGHGTHLGSLINGQDAPLAVPTGQCRYPKLASDKTLIDPAYATNAPAPAALTDVPPAESWNDGSNFYGMAPGSRLVNVKVGAGDGAVDVSQVIAAIDWIVTYGRTNGLNVRVINLSYGTNSAQAWQLDPLSYAAQIAMGAGYVMVVAAGNDGTTATELANPAMNPNILAVGAIDYNDSFDSSQWTVADFASRGSALRSPDMVMPGAHIIGLRVDGSFATTYFPGGLVGDRFIRGSGTSQAAALASGMAALLISKAPGAKPKDVKTILMAASTAVNGDSHYQGSGVIDIEGILEQADQLAALLKATSSTSNAWNGLYGTGSVAAARGPVTLTSAEVPLLGDVDIFGRPFAAATWAKAATAKKAWVGSSWMGVPMASYVKSKWSPTVWGHSSWTGARWSALGWVTDEWSSGSLTGARWSTGNWTGDSWAGARWSGARWSGARWSGARWSGARWSNGSWVSANWASAGWG